MEFSGAGIRAENGIIFWLWLQQKSLIFRQLDPGQSSIDPDPQHCFYEYLPAGFPELQGKPC